MEGEGNPKWDKGEKKGGAEGKYDEEISYTCDELMGETLSISRLRPLN